MMRRSFMAALVAVILATLVSWGAVVPTAAAGVVATARPVAVAAPAGVNGYTILDANGNIYNFGTAYLGGAGKDKVAPFVAMAYTPSGKGYALLDEQGHVYTYGDGVYKGGAPAGASLPFVAIAYKPGTLGYTLLDSKGHIYNYGTTYLGGNPDTNQTYTALAYTPSGNGYILMDRVGHIYSYGDSAYRGGNPAGAQTPMRGLAYKPGTTVYTLLDATGHVYNYGTAYLGGFPAGATAGFVGLVYTPSGNGYALVDGVGHVYSYGDSVHRGGFDSISGSTSSGTGIVGDIFADSTGVPCAAGTRDVGIHDGYRSGTLVRIRLCALPNLASFASESTPGSTYYIQGANGNALVNSRVSGAYFAMINSAKNAGIAISAESAFRSMKHQQYLCSTNTLCKNGNYTYVAKPGTSPHQMGLAIDFSGTNVKGGTSCSSRATDWGSPVWKWLYYNAAKFGFRQYAAESWHWDPLTGSTRC